MNTGLLLELENQVLRMNYNQKCAKHLTMTLNQLKYIVAVARDRNFGRAADACFVSQPTLSAAVKKLEQELDVILFERRSGEVVPTPVGELILDHAQRALEEAAAIREIVTRGADQLSAPLYIGAISTVGPVIFPSLVMYMAENAPGMPLVVEENYASVLTEKLKQGKLDVIVVSLPYEEQGVEILPLYEENFTVLLPSSHPLGKESSITNEQISNQRVLLLGAGHCLRDQILRVCPDCLRTTDSSDSRHAGNVEGSSLETIRYMVASGMGITVLPCSTVTSCGETPGMTQVRPFADSQPKRIVAMVWRRSFPHQQTLSVVEAAIRSCMPDCARPL
jgi:LysR family hydrogen peroxide-inducible transcriptional activator